MSEPNDSESNGPVADLRAKQGSQEAVKVVSTNNLSPQSQQSFYNQPSSGQQIPHQQHPQPQHYQPQTQQPNFTGPRPVLRRTDSRSSLSYRQPAPSTYQNPIPGVQGGIIRQPLPTQPRPPLQGSNYFGQRPLANPGPRFPNPTPLPQQQQQQQAPPIRYSQYDNQAQPDSPFRRAVNTVTESQIRPQRPAVQPGPRPPGIYPQKPLSTAPILQSQPIVGGNIDPGSKKNHILDNLDINASHSAGSEQNDSTIEAKSDISKAKIQNSYQAKSSVDLISGNANEKLQKYDDIRSSSSLGFVQDPEKDFDTAALNGKSSSREEITERPESRSGVLSRDHSTHSSMQKIDEDDDDAVITPARTAYGTGNLRSGKSSKSNSSDNVSQKSLDIGDMQKSTNPSSPAHSDTTELKKSPEIKKSPIVSTRNSTDNISLKSLDIETSRQMKTPSPQPPELSETKKSSPSPVPDAKITPEPVMKPTSLTIHDKVTPTQSPTTTGKPPPSPRPESALDDKDKRRKAQSPKPHDRSPLTSSPKPTKDAKNIKKSPRTESRNAVSRRRTLSGRSRQSEGDNDSGVDESTQGNDRSFNGEQSSPRKTPTKASKLPAGKCKTPIKMLQSPKSPDSAKCVSPSPDKKKVPMNKVQVGAAPSPNIKTVKSKIGSLENTSYKPGGGKVKVENRKIDFSKVQPKIAAKNDTYQPSGGDKKIQQQKLQWNAKSKIGSLENATYKPGGGDKKIESVKLDFKDKAKPKIGSKDNMKHVPGGGDVKSVEEELPEDIENRKLDINAQSKVGSLDNVKHKPGGGEIKIFDDKDYLKQRASGEHSSVLSGSQDEDESDTIISSKKRSNSVKPPTTLNISSASPKRRVRYLDMDGPRSLIGDSPQLKSIDYQRPISACSSYIRKRNRLIRVPIAITDRPPWRY